MAGIFWLASYPKSGNTWFRAFLSNLLADRDEPVDINAMNTGVIASSRRWLDEMLGFSTSDLSHAEIERLRPRVYEWTIRELEQTGYHKTHDAFSSIAVAGAGSPFLGAVYLIRNPLDVASSYAHHCAVSVDAAIGFLNDPGHMMARSAKRISSQVPQFLGSWSGHVAGWVDAPEMRCCVVRYEDMHAEPMRTFTRAASFLGCPVEPARIARSISFSAFDILAGQEEERGFRERPRKGDRFFRQGRTGNWRHELSEEQVRRIVDAHGPTMRRFGYLDEAGVPV